tara:strand:- start:2498 stop:2908 length:411 start_codon:yes stop_codon:yes gene_type:complete
MKDQMKEIISIKESFFRYKQFLKYGFSGITLNLVGYLTYIMLTAFGFDPKMTVVIIAPFFILLTFFVQRKFIFESENNSLKTLLSYLILCLLGNLLNIFLLYVFVDLLFFPHQIIQFLSMIIIGILFYIALRKYVF